MNRIVYINHKSPEVSTIMKPEQLGEPFNVSDDVHTITIDCVKTMIDGLG